MEVIWLIVITTYLFTKLPWAGDSEETFSGVESRCHLPTFLPHSVEASHCLFYCCTPSEKGIDTDFYSFWFDSTGYQTWVNISEAPFALMLYKHCLRWTQSFLFFALFILITYFALLVLDITPHHITIATLNDEQRFFKAGIPLHGEWYPVQSGYNFVLPYYKVCWYIFNLLPFSYREYWFLVGQIFLSSL